MIPIALRKNNLRLNRVRRPATTLCIAAVLALRIAAGQTVVNSTFLGRYNYYVPDPQFYSKAANWDPAEVPNNANGKIYNVIVPAFAGVNLDIDATVENLTLSGGDFSSGGFAYTVIGTTTVGDHLLDLSGPFSIQGSLSDFDASNKTMSSGGYWIRNHDAHVLGSMQYPAATGSLRFPGADIVNNGASITFEGTRAAITDTFGRDALRNFAENLPGARFTVVAGDHTINHAFTNDGLLTVLARYYDGVGASLTLAALTNYDAQSHRLTGGVYDVAAGGGLSSDFPPQPAQLIIVGADIRRNAASITLEVSDSPHLVEDPTFTDERGNNALRNLAENETGGVFQLEYLSQPFQLQSDFVNSGSVLLQMSTLSFPASHAYRQDRGGTNLIGGNINADVEIAGGGLFAKIGLNQNSTAPRTPTITGNLIVGDALLAPIALNVNGSVSLSDTTRFFLDPGGSAQLTAQSTISLAGTLEPQVAYGENRTIAHGAAISGVFKNAPNGRRVSTIDGHGTFLVTYTSTDVTLTNYQPNPKIPQLLNISTRAQVLSGDNAAIGGFIISGSDYKNVVIRAIGPSLGASGVNSPLQDTVIELHDSKGVVVASNDNWQDTEGPELSASGIPPNDPRESGIFAALAPGAYTVVLRGESDTTGTALIEVYDLSSGTQTKLANISTRGFVDAEHELIGGMIAGGSAQDHVQIVVRAIGAGLQPIGVANFLPDTALEVRDKDGALVAANDDFGTPSENEASIPPALRPTDAKDAALALSVAPGSYTAIVHGKNGASGSALVETYDVTQ